MVQWRLLCTLRNTTLAFVAIFITHFMIPDALGQDSKGTDFWITYLPNFHSENPLTNDSLYIFIAAEEPVSGVIEYTNRSGLLFQEPFTISNPAEIFTFRKTYANFELRSFNRRTTGFGSRINLASSQSEIVAAQSFHIISDRDITVYGLNQAYKSSDAFLALPTDALGTEYRILSYNSHGFMFEDERSFPRRIDTLHEENNTPSQFAIVATESDTRVVIEPSVRTLRNGWQAQIVTLNAGETYLVQAGPSGLDFDGDLSGSRITSDKPIAVFSGHQRAQIPYTNSGGSRDHLVQQLFPVDKWGQSAFVVPMRHPRGADSQEDDIYRVIAAFDNTEIYVNDQFVQTLDDGEVYTAPLTQAVHITASQPIMVAQYKKTSNQEISRFESDRLGDPFMTLIPPSEQYLSSYRFLNAQKYNGGGFEVYDDQYIAVVVSQEVLPSIELDGRRLQANLFSPIGNSGYVFANMEMADGVHEITADEGFGLIVYGYGGANSYGYIGGMGLRTLQEAVEVTARDVEICAGSVALLEGEVISQSNGLSYRWEPAEFVAQPNELVTEAFPDTTTTFTLTVEQKEGLPAVTTTSVTVYPRFSAAIEAPDTEEILPGSEFHMQVRIAVEKLSTLRNARVQSFVMSFRHDGEGLAPDKDTLSRIAGLENWSVAISEIIPPDRFVVTGTGPALNAEEIIFGVGMQTFLKASGERTSAIEILDFEVISPSVCISIEEEIELSWSPFCLSSHRGIIVPTNAYALEQNTPNPASGETVIRYSLGIDAPTSLSVYNTQGTLALEAVATVQKSGVYEVRIPDGALPSGVYYYRLASGPFSSTRTMIIAP